MPVCVVYREEVISSHKFDRSLKRAQLRMRVATSLSFASSCRRPNLYICISGEQKHHHTFQVLISYIFKLLKVCFPGERVFSEDSSGYPTHKAVQVRGGGLSPSGQSRAHQLLKERDRTYYTPAEEQHVQHSVAYLLQPPTVSNHLP